MKLSLGVNYMDELKLIFASNLIRLRNEAGLTQAGLGVMINYSDKSVSKWERGEAIPDVAVVKSLAEIFGVSIDYLLSSHDAWEPPAEEEPTPVQRNFDANMVISAALTALATIAILLFVIFWIIGSRPWIIFICFIPAALILLLILNSIWNDGKHNYPIVLGIVLSIFAIIYFALIKYNPWQLIFVLVPSLLVVHFAFRIPKKGTKKSKKRSKNAEKPVE